MAHMRVRRGAQFWGRKRPNKNAKKHFAQSMIDKEKHRAAQEQAAQSPSPPPVPSTTQ